ncbi:MULTISPECIES: HAD hydrolase-like protein [unclassified Thiocapsa]|uniref:HAD hydrolase-like protein n=1 Tax=unclassified Thiocapsa TaxID=2641286 RepID=UPI0035ADF11B
MFGRPRSCEGAASDMIGDDIRSDIAGAQTGGTKTLLLRTGKLRSADLGTDRLSVSSYAACDRPLPRSASIAGRSPLR